MPDDLLKEENDKLPIQQPISQSDGPAVSTEASIQFNPSGQVEDIFENTEKPDDKAGQAGFKVNSSLGQEIAPEKKIESKLSSQPVVSKPKTFTAPPLAKGSAAISRPRPASLTQDSEFDDEPVSSKKKYFIIGLIGILAIIAILVYWFVFHESVVEVADEQANQELQESNTTRSSDPADPQSSPVTESENADIISNPSDGDELNQFIDSDSDQDGLTNEEETQLGTNLLKADSDNDGLFDREEVKVYFTDPVNADTDNDGYLDGEEVVSGFNPKGTGLLLPPIQ